MTLGYFCLNYDTGKNNRKSARIFLSPSRKTNTSLFRKTMMYRPFVPNDPLGCVEKRDVKMSLEIQFNMHG